MMTAPGVLPAGFHSRSATPSDTGAIHDLVAACERDLLGTVETGADGIAADLTRPGVELPDDTLLVHDADERLVARAWTNGGRRCEANVHPGYRGRGLGRALLGWLEARAVSAGSRQLGQTVPDADEDAVALLRSIGYEPLVTAWLFEIATPTEPDVPEPPAGITIRPFRPEDAAAAHQVVEDAFDEWQQRRHSFDEWARVTIERSAFVPAASPVAYAGDELVGVLIALDVPNGDEGYVDRIAVRRDQRGKGLARTLLRYTFREFYRRGMRGCTVWTHSDTGALGLYERVGMTVRRSSTFYSKKLGPVA